MKKIEDWRNHYAQQRCFILGNGPSLADMDLTHLRNEITLGTNSIVLLFHPRHMVLCAKTILSSPSWRMAARLGVKMSEHSFVSVPMTKIGFPPEKITVFPVGSGSSWFSDDPTVRPFCKNSSSGAVMQQMAVYLGCNPIYMIGFDGGYVAEKEGEGDPNHFSPEYWGDLDPMNKSRADQVNAGCAKGHVVAKEYCDAHGIDIYNATPGGDVDTYERVDYESIFTT